MSKIYVHMVKKHVLPALLLLSLLAGCGCSGPSPEEVIAKAIDAISELQTYRFEMTGTMTMDGETSQGNIQGEFVSPDRLHVTTTSNVETEEGISIGQAQYQLSHNGEWEIHEWSAALPSGYIDLAVIVAELLDSLIELSKLGNETIDGVSCFHYRGSIDIEAQVEEQIANLDPTQPYYEDMVKSIEQQLQSDQSVEFWVGKEDYLLRRVYTQYEMVFTEDEGEDTENQVHVASITNIGFYDFNEPITIEPPIAD